jgi:ATP-dependent Lon protease
VPMAQLNKTFIEKLKSEFESTRFSSNDFTYIYPTSGKILLVMTFKYDDEFTFQISEEEEYELVTQKGAYTLAMGGTSERKNKSIENYVTYSPGEYKKTDKVDIYDIGNASDYIEKWCSYIYKEISYKEVDESFFDELRHDMEEKFKDSIENEAESFSDEELGKINSKFDDLLSKFEILKEESKITQEELNRVKDELDGFKSTAKVMPKGLWAKITNNKLVDIAVSFAKSKEGRDFVISEIKKLTLCG